MRTRGPQLTEMVGGVVVHLSWSGRAGRHRGLQDGAGLCSPGRWRVDDRVFSEVFNMEFYRKHYLGISEALGFNVFVPRPFTRDCQDVTFFHGKVAVSVLKFSESSLVTVGQVYAPF